VPYFLDAAAGSLTRTRPADAATLAYDSTRPGAAGHHLLRNSGPHTLHTGGPFDAHLLLPVIRPVIRPTG
jgi:hypothetical protein